VSPVKYEQGFISKKATFFITFLQLDEVPAFYVCRATQGMKWPWQVRHQEPGSQVNFRHSMFVCLVPSVWTCVVICFVQAVILNSLYN
jgi:hypothetical protein